VTRSVISGLATIVAAVLVGSCSSHADLEAKNGRALNWCAYPDTEAMRYYRESHATPYNWGQPFANGERGSTDAVLVMTWFRSPNIGLRYCVLSTGREFDVRDVYNWAFQASRSRQMSAREFAKLKGTAESLPDSEATPALNRLVIVSHWAKGKWRTERYDQKQLPAGMEKIMNIVGERFETKERAKTAGASEK
jgi:hypothetical protein